MKNKVVLQKIETNKLNSTVYVLTSIGDTDTLCTNLSDEQDHNWFVSFKSKKHIVASVRLINGKDILCLVATDSEIFRAMQKCEESDTPYLNDFYKFTHSNDEIEAAPIKEDYREYLHAKFEEDCRVLRSELNTIVVKEDIKNATVAPKLQEIFNSINSKVNTIPQDNISINTFTEEEITKMSKFLADKLPPVLFKGDKSTIEVLKEFLKTYKID